MRIVLIGATGTIGGPLAENLAARHEVIRVGRTRGDMQVDIESPDSLRALFQAVAPFDAVVSAAGSARFGPLEQLTDEDFGFSLANKLMGQVNLVRIGLGHINDRGSFTLTSGILSQEPIPGSSAISLVNAALEGFVRAAALDMPRGVRINIVSPPWVTQTLAAMDREGPGGMPAVQVARAYVESVEGSRTGAVLDARAPRP
jgi:NAD(P)-dependent dehydrogenase (short-subunit alcohol dehydrogenase family)